MRNDHHAYQRATRVAGIGLLTQILFGLVLLIFAIIGPDTPFFFASTYVFAGSLVWLSLIVVSYQHKLERLEALEEDELAATRGTSIFESDLAESRVAARRLQRMHKWLMPAVSVLMAIVLAWLAWGMLSFFDRLDNPVEEIATTFDLTPHRGWAIATCLAIALVSFIFSRFVAGMAKQSAWQNLRGGAGYMVGNALVMLAIAVGIAFRFFGNEDVIYTVTYALPFFMFVLAAEIVINLILNLYRPRIPGETPRPAFDSKLLSYFTAPDSLVRSLNEAVNYQFGFDVTSTWGYQLLLRSFLWLVALAAFALIVLNTMVVVEPHEQAVRMRGGEVIAYQEHPGILYKWPWPFESARVFDVSRVRRLPLTARVLERRGVEVADRVYTWDNELETDREFEPLIVRASRLTMDDIEARSTVREQAGAAAELIDEPVEVPASKRPGARDDEDARAAVTDRFSLVDAEVALRYRIRSDGGLQRYLDFGSDLIERRQQRSNRERVLQVLAMREINRKLAGMTIDDVLTSKRAELAEMLRASVQNVFDQWNTGVELVGIDMPMMRPSGNAANAFEELAISREARRRRLIEAERQYVTTMTYLLGDVELTEKVVAAMDQLEAVDAEHEANAPAVLQQRREVEQLLIDGGGQAAQQIADASADRWVEVMDKRQKATRAAGQTAAYNAAPQLYRQREYMGTISQMFGPLRKYVVAIDPSRLNVQFDLIETSPIFDTSTAFSDEEEGSTQNE